MDAGTWTRAIALVGGLAVGFILSQTTFTAIATPAFAGLLAIGMLVGEVTLPRPPRSTTASATIEVRQVRDYLPRQATWGVVAMAATVVAAITTIGLAGLLDRPDLPSGSFDPGWYGPFSEYGPWAGHGLGGLLASTLGTIVGTLVLGMAALRMIALSPRTGVDAEHRQYDEAWRRRTAATVIATIGVIVSLPLAVVSFAVSAAMRKHAYGEWLAQPVLMVVPAVVGALALIGFAAYVAMLLLRPDLPTVPVLPAPSPDLAQVP